MSTPGTESGGTDRSRSSLRCRRGTGRACGGGSRARCRDDARSRRASRRYRCPCAANHAASSSAIQSCTMSRVTSGWNCTAALLPCRNAWTATALRASTSTSSGTTHRSPCHVNQGPAARPHRRRCRPRPNRLRTPAIVRRLRPAPRRVPGPRSRCRTPGRRCRGRRAARRARRRSTNRPSRRRRRCAPTRAERRARSRSRRERSGSRCPPRSRTRGGARSRDARGGRRRVPPDRSLRAG